MAGRGRPKLQKLNVDLEWLRSILRNRRLTQRELADLVKIDTATMSRVLAGDRRIDLEKACNLATILRAPLGEVARRLGYDYSSIRIPITGALKGDGTVTTISAKVGTSVPGVIAAPGASVLLAEIPDGPLQSYNGALIYYNPAAGVGSHVPPDAFGRLCVVEAEGYLTPILATLAKADRRGVVSLVMFGTNERREVKNVLRASVVTTIVLN